MTLFDVTLGGVVLRPTEVPDNIPWGGDQMVASKTLIGGTRVVDAMGRSESDLEWSGRFWGVDALSRAQMFDAMRVAGQAVDLFWAGLSFSVVIKRFTPNFHRINDIPYSIVCEVITNSSIPDPVAPSNLDDQMQADNLAAANLMAQITDPGMQTAFSVLTTVLAGIPSFVGASLSSIAPAVAAITGVQTAAQALMTTTAASMATGSFAGVVAGSQANASAITAQATASALYPVVSQVNNIMSRMAVNLAASQVSGTSLAVIGGDLYSIAANVYGDANEWPTIAAANGLIDPLLTGVLTTLVIPADKRGADGLLSP